MALGTFPPNSRFHPGGRQKMMRRTLSIRFFGGLPYLVFFTLAGWLPAAAGGLGAQTPDEEVEEERDTAEGRLAGVLLLRTQVDTLPRIPVDPIVVTVLRSPITMDRAPFALSVLGEGATTAGRTGAFLEEALHGLPGVQVQNRFNDAVGERLSIRGFGARSQFGVRGVRVVVDGIPATLPDGQSTLDHVDLGSVGRVEILRGPGSALYGNSAGGVLTLETRPPPSSPIRQEVRGVWGSHGLSRLQSTTGGTVSNTGYLVNVARYETDGFRMNPMADGRPYGAGARDHVNAQVTHPVAGGFLRSTFNYVDLSAENPGSLAQEAFDARQIGAFPFNVVQGTSKDMWQGQLGLAWTAPAGPGQVEVSAYGIRRDLVNPIPSHIIDLDRSAAGVRVLLRGESGANPGWVDWALGVEADLQRDDRKNFQNEGDATRGELTLDQAERVLGGAVFLQALLPIVPNLDVMTGLRYDRIHFRARDRMAGRLGPDGELMPDGTGERSLDSASPSLGIHFGPSSAFGIYANLATAFETPSTTELANRPDGAGGFNPDLEPQVGVTTEIGARGVLGSTVAYELALFHTTLRNELIPFEVPESPGRTFFRNAGTSERNGVEASVRLAPSPIFFTQLTYSLTDGHFRRFQVGDEDFSGNRIPGLAPQRAEAVFRLSPGPAFLELRTEWVDRVHADDANTPEGRAPAYWVADLRAGVDEAVAGGFRIAPLLGVTNLLDRFHAASVVPNAFGGRYFEPGPGRSLYLGAGISWERR